MYIADIGTLDIYYTEFNFICDGIDKGAAKTSDNGYNIITIE